MKSILTTILFAAFASSAFAQTDDAIVKDCNEQSVRVSGSDPLKAVDAQVAAFQNCVAGRIPNVQRRTISLHRNWQAFCNKSADNDVKRDTLTTAAERTEAYKKCMALHDYIVQ